VYPLPDGEVVFEYRLPGGVVVRDIVEGDGRGQRMVSFHDGRAAEFVDFVLRSGDQFHTAFERRRDNRRWGGLTEFDLAA
jgi:hypothetical protein